MPAERDQPRDGAHAPPTLVVLAMQGSGGPVLADALEHCGGRVVLCEGLQELAGVPFGESGLACIHLARHPLGVAATLAAARGLDAPEALVLWEAFNARSLQASEGSVRVLLSCAELGARPVQRFGLLVEELAARGIGGLRVPGDDSVREIFSALEKDDAAGGDGLLAPSQEALWHRLSGKHPEQPGARRDREQQAPWGAPHERDAQAALKLKVKEQAKELGILNQRVAWLDAQVMALQASSSWRITAPLRSVSSAVRRTRRLFGAGPGGMFPGRRTTAGVGQARPPRVLEGEDTFVLYRIIGNDLYPRHKRGQSIENLRFILEHEPVLEGCEKRFVLNRLLDAGQEEEIIGLLAAAGLEYFRIPFDPAEYARIGFDVDALPEPGFLSGGRFDALDEAARDRLLGALYRHKNNYVMNNNGARNAALEDGRGRAKWILPWDGNCFLTHEAWGRIRGDVAKAPGNRYFVVPMARMPSNALLITGGDVPRPVEEPQVIFRSDAAERFNEAFCYGRRPKVELLWRLGVKGAWDDYSDDPWDQPRTPLSPDAEAVGRAGWVARLSSGMATLEATSDQAPLHRGLVRTGAILATLQHLDAGLSGMSPDQPVSIRPAVLRQEVAGRDEPPLAGLVAALELAAERAVAEEPAATADAFDASFVLALAWAFTGQDRYAARGAELLRHVFIDPGTEIAARASGAAAATPPGGMAGLHHCLDAVRLFEGGGNLGPSDRAGLREWLVEHLDWLQQSPDGRAGQRASNHRGTCHDLQVATIASFLDDQEMVYDCLVRAQSRIGTQFAPDGSQPEEASGSAPALGCCYNFQAWVSLAELGARWGVDLWQYRARHGGGLAQGARWLLSRPGAESWPGGEEEGRLQPIWFAAREVVGGLPGVGCWPASPYEARPVFPAASGIRPFWNLASHGQPAVALPEGWAAGA